jgi:hypothetical protein
MYGLGARFPLRSVGTVTLLSECESSSILAFEKAHDAQRKRLIFRCVVDAMMFIAG